MTAHSGSVDDREPHDGCVRRRRLCNRCPVRPHGASGRVGHRRHRVRSSAASSNQLRNRTARSSGALIQIMQGAERREIRRLRRNGIVRDLRTNPGTRDGSSVDGTDSRRGRRRISTSSSDTKIAVELFPTPPTNSSGATATGRCNDGSWTWATSRADACVNSGGLAYGVCPGPLCKSGM